MSVSLDATSVWQGVALETESFSRDRYALPFYALRVGHLAGVSGVARPFLDTPRRAPLLHALSSEKLDKKLRKLEEEKMNASF
jgi:hypothetical protein